MHPFEQLRTDGWKVEANEAVSHRLHIVKTFTVASHSVWNNTVTQCFLIVRHEYPTCLLSIRLVSV